MQPQEQITIQDDCKVSPTFPRGNTACSWRCPKKAPTSEKVLHGGESRTFATLTRQIMCMRTVSFNALWSLSVHSVSRSWRSSSRSNSRMENVRYIKRTAAQKTQERRCYQHALA